METACSRILGLKLPQYTKYVIEEIGGIGKDTTYARKQNRRFTSSLFENIQIYVGKDGIQIIPNWPEF